MFECGMFISEMLSALMLDTAKLITGITIYLKPVLTLADARTLSISRVCSEQSEKNENTQRAAVLWVKPLCWCHRSEGNGQIGDRKEFEGNRNSNDPLLQSGYAEEPLSKHKSSKSKSWWTTAAEDHTKTQLKNTWNTLPPGSDESRFLLPY